MHKLAKNTAKNSASNDVVIPDKLYFRIGEVSRLCGLPSYVLRFWETEFPQLKPPKSGAGQRTYRRPDVENVLRIKKLLYDQGFTIAGARQQLRAEIKKKAGGSALRHTATQPGRTEAGPAGAQGGPGDSFLAPGAVTGRVSVVRFSRYPRKPLRIQQTWL